MDAALRIAHIIFGVFWGGLYIFNTFFLMPKLHGLEAKIRRSFLKSLLSTLSPVAAVSVLIIIGTGTAMTFRFRGGDISTLLTTGWGVSIFIGFVATVIATIIGFSMLMPMGLRIEKIYRTIGKDEPNAEQASELDDIITRLEKIERFNFILVMIALVSMPVARFV
jgi:hypothetical protein